MGIGSSGVANYANTRLALAIRTIALGNMGDFEVVSDDGVGLGLNFQTTTVLDPRITFSRASNATLVGSDGLIQYAPHNLLTYSENFDDAVWIKTTSTVTANTVIAPDGTITADTLTANGVDSALGEQNISTTAGQSYVFSVYLKADAPTILSIFIVDGGGGSGNTQQVVSVTTSWQRFTVTRTLSAGTTVVSCQIGGANSFSTGESVYLWGAQLNEGSLQPYYTTSVKNLLNYSQNFDNATGWVSAAPYSVTPNTITGPDGVTNADAIILASGSTSFNTNVTRQIVTKAASAIRYTHSCYIKAKGATTSVRIVDFGSTTANSALVIVSLIDGSIISAPSVTGTFTGASVVVESLQNGWFRVALTYTSDTATTLTIRHFPYNGSTQLVGDGVSGLYLWGAQLSDSASLDPYSYNFVAAPTSTAYYGPRFDYDPVTLAPKGLLIEEQRTNSIRNNTMQGAVIGTPGTLPTNYTYTGGGLVANVVNIGYEDGINYIDIHFVGTATSGSSGLRFEGTAGVAAATGQTWNHSFFVRKVSGTSSGVSVGANLTYLIAGTSSDATTAGIPLATLDSASIAYNRQSVTLTSVTAGITSVRPQLLLGHATGNNVDITLRIGMPQLEQGAFPTSVIPTTSAEVTRAADNASMVGTDFSSWYNQSEGTFAVGFDMYYATVTSGAFPRAISCSNGTNLNLIDIQSAQYANENFTINDLGTQQCSINLTQFSANTSGKVSGAYALNSFQAAGNGILGTADNLGTVPTVNQMQIGNRWDLARPMSGHIQSIRYYPRRLANGDLQAITS